MAAHIPSDGTAVAIAVADLLDDLALRSPAVMKDAQLDRAEAGWQDAALDEGLAVGDLLLDIDATELACCVVVRHFPGAHELVSDAASRPYMAPGFRNADAPRDPEPGAVIPPWFGPRRDVGTGFVARPPAFAWHVASVFTALLRPATRPESHSKARAGISSARVSVDLQAGRHALDRFAAMLASDSALAAAGFPAWSLPRVRRALGFGAEATRFTPSRLCEARLAPLVARLAATLHPDGIVAPTHAADDGLVACLSLVAVPRDAIDAASGLAYTSAHALTRAGFQLRLDFDQSAGVAACLQLVGHRPSLVQRRADTPDAAGRLPVFVDPCSWIGLAGVVAFVLLHGDRFGVLVVDPQATSRQLRVYVRSDTPDDARIVVLAAPFGESGWAAVSVGGGGGEDASAPVDDVRCDVPWAQVRQHTEGRARPRAAGPAQTDRWAFHAGLRGVPQRDDEARLDPEVFPVVVDIEADHLARVGSSGALRYACATTAIAAEVPPGATDDDDWFAQSAPQEQVNLPPPKPDWSCDGDVGWRSPPLEAWRKDFKTFASGSQNRLRESHWRGVGHTHAPLPTGSVGDFGGHR